MSERLRLRLYKCDDPIRFRAALDQAVRDYDAQLVWRSSPSPPAESCRTAAGAGVQVLYLPFLMEKDASISFRVGFYLACPWLELRIQEESLWDYSLYIGEQHLHSFSTLPEYWDDDLGAEAIAQARGNPAELASVWGVPLARIERYLVHWGMKINDDGTFESILTGKAYREDHFEYGDYLQMYDVLRALGGLNPNTDGLQHTLVLGERGK